jgi:hypothetical protein
MRSAARPKCSKITSLDEAFYRAKQTNWRFRFGLAFVTIAAKGKYNLRATQLPFWCGRGLKIGASAKDLQHNRSRNTASST